VYIQRKHEIPGTFTWSQISKDVIKILSKGVDMNFSVCMNLKNPNQAFRLKVILIKKIQLVWAIGCILC